MSIFSSKQLPPPRGGGISKKYFLVEQSLLTNRKKPFVKVHSYRPQEREEAF